LLALNRSAGLAFPWLMRLGGDALALPRRLARRHALRCAGAKRYLLPDPNRRAGRRGHGQALEDGVAHEDDTSGPRPEAARLAALLAWVAGGVDAIGYVVLAHLFTAHVSGDSVVLGVALGRGQWATVAERGITIGLFATGIAIGAGIGTWYYARGVRHPTVGVFAVEMALLAAFLGFGSAAMVDGEIRAPAPWPFYGLVALPTLAMGLQSATLRRVGHASVRTPYVSGVLTSLVESVVEWLLWRRAGGPAAAPTTEQLSPAGRVRLYGSVLGCYIVGAGLGSAALLAWGLAAVLLPILGLALVMARDLHHPHELAEPLGSPNQGGPRQGGPS
jgi:uncharacterized membrane protein YoaK (UPF0700 family)